MFRIKADEGWKITSVSFERVNNMSVACKADTIECGIKIGK